MSHSFTADVFNYIENQVLNFVNNNTTHESIVNETSLQYWRNCTKFIFRGKIIRVQAFNENAYKMLMGIKGVFYVITCSHEGDLPEVLYARIATPLERMVACTK